MSSGISILILTKNEEANLPGCLASVSWSDDIHVLDSRSTDATVAIAEKAGAHVSYRDFDSFAGQQNWALKNIPFRHKWVFYLDADERATPELSARMQQVVAESQPNVAFKIRRRDFFMGRWLKHVQTSPYYMRLFLVDKMSYERLGHPVSVPDGPTDHLSGYLDHYPFSKGLRDWFDRHNFYSTQEAQQIIIKRGDAGRVSLGTALFAKDFHTRRAAQKELYYKLPFRPTIKFLAMYILKRGFMDGRAGFVYARLIAIYEYMIIVKTKEIEIFEKLGSVERPKDVGA